MLPSYNVGNDPESNIFYDCNTGDEDESFQDSIQDFNQDTPYNIADYARLAMNLQREIKPKQMRKHHINPEEIQACLAYLPIETVKQTLKCTTQLTKWHVKLPLQKHWEPRFSFLNVHRLREPVATDTFWWSHMCSSVPWNPESHDQCLSYAN